MLYYEKKFRRAFNFHSLEELIFIRSQSSSEAFESATEEGWNAINCCLEYLGPDPLPVLVAFSQALDYGRLLLEPTMGITREGCFWE